MFFFFVIFILCRLPAIIYFLPVFRLGEGGHGTFTCRIIIFSKITFWFFALIGWETILMIFWLAVIFQRDFRPEAGQKTEWYRQSEFLRGRVFFCVSFNYNSLKAECCSGEDVLAVPRRFLVNHKGVGMFQSCLQNENGDIFPRSTPG